MQDDLPSTDKQLSRSNGAETDRQLDNVTCPITDIEDPNDASRFTLAFDPTYDSAEILITEPMHAVVDMDRLLEPMMEEPIDSVVPPEIKPPALTDPPTVVLLHVLREPCIWITEPSTESPDPITTCDRVETSSVKNEAPDIEVREPDIIMFSRTDVD
jgi:hypothetical protein